LIVGIGLVLFLKFLAPPLSRKRKRERAVRHPRKGALSVTKDHDRDGRGPVKHLTLIVRDSVSAPLVDRLAQSNGGTDRLS
jgi:hypothetical protein